MPVFRVPGQMYAILVRKRVAFEERLTDGSLG